MGPGSDIPDPGVLRPALFLDRDGVVNVEKHYLFRIEDFEFMEGVLEICADHKARGFKLVVVTNQAGVARGFYGLDDVERLHEWMRGRFRERGVPLDGVYFCPHHPSVSGGCECRKPRPGMLLRASRELGIDLPNSVLLGDKESDLEAGRRAGVRRLGLVRGARRIESIDWREASP
jgi:D-glycero-D-manno-heptose 1,7-bisphosphate phosphatase